MSGLEVAGVVLGALPLLISGLEHWREVARIGNFLRHFKREYSKCLKDLRYQNVVYRGNLRALLLPLVDHNEAEFLISNPGDKAWNGPTLCSQMEIRLQGAYELYLEIIEDMNEAVQDLKKELSVDDTAVQGRVSSTSSINIASARTKFRYERFRFRFSLNEPARDECVDRLEECNKRLKRLLDTGNTINAIEPVTAVAKKRSEVLESVFKISRKKSRLLYMALDRSWQCACQPHHYVHLRLEHRTKTETSFEIILASVNISSSVSGSWSWKELQCGDTLHCNVSKDISLSIPSPPSLTVTEPATPAEVKQVTFTLPSSPSPTLRGLQIGSHVQLCQTLASENCSDCMGVLSKDDESYHLHPSKRRKKPIADETLTLDSVLSNQNLTRRQRYILALLMASSIAQLEETPWLTTGLKKEHVLFHPCEDDDCTVPYHEPFICQGFSQPSLTNASTERNDGNFYALGILLLELCFARRLEDHPYRQSFPVGAGEAKEAFDLVAALKWSHDVRDEGGHEYASAVSWCFTNARDQSQTWRAGIIKNVVRPLEICQEHFNALPSD